MKVLHLFMFLLFVIGLLLLMTSFTAYSKLDDTCRSDGLRSKLRLSICIGTVLVTLSIGYMVCLNKGGCKCDFGERSDWKIYSMLGVLMVMGGGLLALTIGIKNDAKKDGCHIDLGSIPDILIGLSIAQIIIPIAYIVYIVTNLPKNKKTKNDEEEEEEEDDDESLALEAESRREAIDKRRKIRYKASIAKKEEELSKVNDRIENARSRGKSNPKDKAKRDLLAKQIKEESKQMSSIGSSSISDSSKDDDDDDDGPSLPAWLK